MMKRRAYRYQRGLTIRFVMDVTPGATSTSRPRDASFFIDIRDLAFEDHISGGASSLVYRGRWHRCPVAIKKWFDPTSNALTLQEFNAEVLTVRQLRHPNVVQFFGACGHPPELCLVMEYLPTSLFDLLHKGRTPLDDRRLCALALDISRALLYLHAQVPPVIHRDLKPANFLLDRTWRVKLCDFGLASALPHQRRAGTVAYMAPELLDHDAPFNASVDVYAFGILLNEMVARRIPHDGLSEGDIRRRTLRGERPEIPLSCAPPLRRLIESCWQQEARNRPAISDVHDRLQQHLSSIAHETSQS